MGLFDWPSPALDFVDNLFRFLPPFIRLLLWGVSTGLLSMLCYRACSDQQRIATARQAATASRDAMGAYEGHEFAELWQLASVAVRDSMRHFGRVLGPALLGSLPALCIIVWASNSFAYRLPAVGEPVILSPSPPVALNLPRADDEGGYTIGYPAAANPVIVRTPGYARDLLHLPLTAGVPVIHKQLWWNRFIGNPLGYLPADAPMQALHIQLQPQEFLGSGPSWLRNWAFIYFSALLLSSLAIKFLLRIH